MNTTNVSSCCFSSPCASLFHSWALVGRGVRHASARLARGPEHSKPEHRAPASTARKQGNLGRPKLTNIESRFSRMRRRLPCHNHPPHDSAAAVDRGKCARHSKTPSCPPACMPCHRASERPTSAGGQRPPSSAPLERRECCAARARTGEAGAGPAQANSARVARAHARAVGRAGEHFFYASTDCLRRLHAISLCWPLVSLTEECTSDRTTT